MRFAKATATLAFLLAVTGTFAAPLPRHSQGEEDVEISHPHNAHGHHHHHGHRHRVSLAKWIHAHLHYPHRWPFHPHHDTQGHLQQDVEENERPKNSGSMLRFWLHSHFAPHTSKLRTHRGKAIPDSNQKVLSSSFDDKPPSDEDGLKARDFETHSTPEPEGDGSHEPHHELHRQVKGLHKAGHELHKLGKMVEEMGNVHDAVEKLHLRVGMAAAKLGHKSRKESGREIDELD